MKKNLPPNFRPPLDYPEYPFHGLLKTAAERRPDDVALIEETKELTFGELDARSNACAHALLASGAQPGDRVGLYLPNSVEFAIAAFGVSKAGAVFTPMNPSYKEAEIRHQLTDSGARLLITDAAGAETAGPLRGDLPDLKEVIALGGEGEVTDFHEWLSAHPEAPPPEPKIDQAEDLVALPYSSGTTGLPKGVMLTHRNLVANYHQFVANHQITHRDSGLLFLPLYHIYGTMIMGGLTLAGAKQVLMRRFGVEEALGLVERHRLSLFYGVPPALLAIAQHEKTGDYDLSSLRYIMSGAAPLPPEVRRQTQERTGVLTFMGYGLTEASPLTHMNPPVAELIEEESIGLPISDEEQKIVDIETGEKEMPVGEPGELILRGPHIMKGYWRAPEATREALRGGWLYTGDIGHMDERGYVYLSDRKKEMIKYKGFSVAPAELDALLHQHPDIADAAVAGKPDPEAGEIPKAFIVPKEGANLSADQIMAFVKDRVSGYKQIREVEFIEAIPKSGSGKILRRMLKERA